MNNQEFETYRQKIQKLTSENTRLNEEVRNVQENLWLPANQMAKLNKLKIICNENEELKKRIDKLVKMVENKNK